MKRFLAVACFVAALAAQAVQAAPAPLDLYIRGDYETAIAAGIAEKNAAGFAVAARAALAVAAMKDTPCLECLKRAEVLARRAVAADPKQAEGQVFLAVALGYEARIVGPVSAKLKAYAEQAKTNLDAALTEEPRNALALAALGGWNIEIVRNGGARLADWLYGADVEKGLTAFRKAFDAAPDNPVLRYQFALSLAGYDRERFHREIEDALATSLRLAPRTTYERFVHVRAGELLDALHKPDRKNFDRLVKHDQGYP